MKRIYTRVRHDFKYWFIGGGYTKLYNINFDDPRAFINRGLDVGIMITIKLLVWNIEIYLYKPMSKVIMYGVSATVNLNDNIEYLPEQDNRDATKMVKTGG